VRTNTPHGLEPTIQNKKKTKKEAADPKREKTEKTKYTIT
jgi:hypothetical protein